MSRESPSASLVDRRLLESIERAFAAHAGSDARIDVSEMRIVLGLRTEAVARRMFEIFDVDHDGSISRVEFVAAVRALIGGSTRDKLAFAFRLHDENSDGTIDESELRRMLAIGLAEDDVSIDAARVDHATRMYFAEADANADGWISFEEFEALTSRYPALLDQMTRTEARWIAPNEDLIARLDPVTRPNRAHSRANRRRQVVFLAVWVALNAALFASEFLASGGKQRTWLDHLGNACTTCLQIDVGILVLAAMRRLLTWVRSSRLGRVLPIDDAITFHRIVGHSMFAFAIGHGTARIVSYMNQTRRPFWDEMRSGESLTGIAALVILATMWFFARETIRRSHRFELFYVTHLLYLPFFVVAAIHAPSIIVGFGGIAIAALLVEHALRLRARGRRARVISAITLRSGVTRLELAKPPGFSHRAGDYVFVRLPEVARHEWHPFTLSSAPESQSLTMHVRSLGNWTTALRSFVEQRSPDQDIIAYLDGPYGSPSRHLFEARFAVMIGAGIGVTPFASILESIAQHEPKTLGRLEKAHFYWLNRDQYSFEWFAALLATLETQKHAEQLDIHIHMTGGHAGLSAAGLEVARELLREKGLPDLVTGLLTKTHMGHPDWESELAAIQRGHAPDPVHIYFCGPPGLGRTIETIANRLGMPYREEKF